MIFEFVQSYNRLTYVHTFWLFTKMLFHCSLQPWSYIRELIYYRRVSFAQRTNASLYFSTVGSFDCGNQEVAMAVS